MDGTAAGRVLVIGAGIAGLACARALAEAGRAVTVLEKSRGLGGRCATRRRAGIAVDHGAPFAEVADPAFASVAAGWAATGHAARWDAGAPGAVVGLPGMSGLAVPMAGGLDLRREARAVALDRAGTLWSVTVEDGTAEEAETVLLAVPAPQAAALLGPETARFPGLEAVEMAPCWTAMAAWETPLAAPADLLEGDGTPLALAIRNGAKPGRDPAPDAWVLHAGAGWSADWLEASPDVTGPRLLAAFAGRLGIHLAPPDVLMVHRWRYARVERPLGAPCAWDVSGRLGLAGDWCEGPGVEAAWLSGHALARAVLEG